MSAPMPWTLEVVWVPVTDVDRAKAFYADRVGFHVDHDTAIGGSTRFVQLTPPGSGCSIVIGTVSSDADLSRADMPPGSLRGLQLVVPDVVRAQAELARRGVDVSEVSVIDRDGPRPRRDDDNLDNIGFCWFRDPDGNGWAIQQISARGTGR